MYAFMHKSGAHKSQRVKPLYSFKLNGLICLRESTRNLDDSINDVYLSRQKQ